MTFKRGASLYEEEAKRRAAKSGGVSTLQYRLDYGESKAPVIFLDNLNEVPAQLIHKLFFGKRDSHMAVCTSDEGHCILCDAAGAAKKGWRSPASFFTVLDLRPYTKKDGTVVPITKKLMLCTKQSYELIVSEALEQADGELQYAMFEVSRGPEAQPSPPITGSKFRFKAHVALADYELTEEDKTPFTLDELSATLVSDPDMIKELALRLDPDLEFGEDVQDQGSESNEAYDVDEDLPF